VCAAFHQKDLYGTIFIRGEQPVKKQMLLVAIFAAFTLNTHSNFRSTDAAFAGPLEPCTYVLAIKPGIAPTFFLDRKPAIFFFPHEELEVYSDPRKTPITSFSDAYRLPFYLSGEIGYALNCNMELFAEIAWRHASGQTVLDSLIGTPPLAIQEQFTNERLGSPKLSKIYTDFNTIAFYIGAKYYYDQCYECINPFLGLKLGVLHHNNIHIDYTLIDVDRRGRTKEGTKIPIKGASYLSNYVVSGGVTFGFNTPIPMTLLEGWIPIPLFEDCLSFEFGVDIIAAGCLKNNRMSRIDVPLEETGDLFNMVDTEQIGVDFFIPITFGIFYEY